MTERPRRPHATDDASDPHAGQPVTWAGAPPSRARLAVVLVHGRGGSPEDMLALAQELALDDVAFAAPRAAGSTWYPHSFLAPLAENEPWLGSALDLLDGVVAEIGGRGVPPERVGLLGFSQGACLALELAVRRPRRYAALAGLSGGLIGPPGTPREMLGDLAGTSAFLGCSDADPHVPLDRFQETAAVLRRMGAVVDARVYAGMGHTVNRDEIRAVRALLGSPAA